MEHNKDLRNTLESHEDIFRLYRHLVAEQLDNLSLQENNQGNQKQTPDPKQTACQPRTQPQQPQILQCSPSQTSNNSKCWPSTTLEECCPFKIRDKTNINKVIQFGSGWKQAASLERLGASSAHRKEDYLRASLYEKQYAPTSNTRCSLVRSMLHISNQMIVYLLDYSSKRFVDLGSENINLMLLNVTDAILKHELSAYISAQDQNGSKFRKETKKLIEGMLSFVLLDMADRISSGNPNNPQVSGKTIQAERLRRILGNSKLSNRCSVSYSRKHISNPSELKKLAKEWFEWYSPDASVRESSIFVDQTESRDATSIFKGLEAHSKNLAIIPEMIVWSNTFTKWSLFIKSYVKNQNTPEICEKTCLLYHEIWNASIMIMTYLSRAWSQAERMIGGKSFIPLIIWCQWKVIRAVLRTRNHLEMIKQKEEICGGKCQNLYPVHKSLVNCGWKVREVNFDPYTWFFGHLNQKNIGNKNELFYLYYALFCNYEGDPTQVVVSHLTREEEKRKVKYTGPKRSWSKNMQEKLQLSNNNQEYKTLLFQGYTIDLPKLREYLDKKIANESTEAAQWRGALDNFILVSTKMLLAQIKNDSSDWYMVEYSDKGNAHIHAYGKMSFVHELSPFLKSIEISLAVDAVSITDVNNF